MLLFGSPAVWLSGLLWLALWIVGGWWLGRTCFNLRQNEQALIGLALGLVLQAWVANLLAPWMAIGLAFWLGSVVTFIAGLGLTLWRDGRRGLLAQSRISPWQIGGFCFLLYLFIAIGRGMAISDDFQNLPIAAMLAVGDIPLRFPLDPAVNYPYHYLNLLMAGQFIHFFNLLTWTGVDVARGLTFALATMLAGLWAQRLTRSALVGYLNGLVFALAGGTRWLFLLFPASLLANLSAHINLIGSGKASALDLATALTGTWATAGAGPYPFPFAFVNGFNPPMMINYHSGGGAVGALIIWLLLLTHNRQRGLPGWVLISLLLAASALAGEATLVFFCAGMGLLVVYDLIKCRSLRPSPQVGAWLGVVLAAGILSLLQGWCVECGGGQPDHPPPG